VGRAAGPLLAVNDRPPRPSGPVPLGTFGLQVVVAFALERIAYFGARTAIATALLDVDAPFPSPAHDALSSLALRSTIAMLGGAVLVHAAGVRWTLLAGGAAIVASFATLTVVGAGPIEA